MLFKKLRRKLRSRKKELPPEHDRPDSGCPGGRACQHFDNNGKVYKIPHKVEQRLANPSALIPDKSATYPYKPAPSQSQTTSRPVATVPPPSRSQTRPRVAAVSTTTPSQIAPPAVTVSTTSQSQITPTVATEPTNSQPEITAPVTTVPTALLPQIAPLAAHVSTPSLASSESTIELPERFPQKATVPKTLQSKPSPPVTTAPTPSQSKPSLPVTTAPTPSQSLYIPGTAILKETPALAKKRHSFRVGNSLYEWDSVKKTYEERELPPKDTKPDVQTKARRQPQHDSGSVTIEERIRFQRIALGMTDAQIERALPPGHYTVQSRGTGLQDRPSGRGDLAYAYYAQ